MVMPNSDRSFIMSQYYCCMCGNVLVAKTQSDIIEKKLRIRRIFRCKHCRCDRFYEEGWK